MGTWDETAFILAPWNTWTTLKSISHSFGSKSHASSPGPISTGCIFNAGLSSTEHCRMDGSVVRYAAKTTSLSRLPAGRLKDPRMFDTVTVQYIRVTVKSVSGLNFNLDKTCITNGWIAFVHLKWSPTRVFQCQLSKFNTFSSRISDLQI